MKKEERTEKMRKALIEKQRREKKDKKRKGE